MQVKEQPEVITLRDERYCRFFNWASRHQLKKHCHAVRLLDAPDLDSYHGSLVFCMNHPSWNDPMVVSLLHFHYFSDYDHYGPIDADALEAYGFMKKIGLYGIRHNDMAETRKFLRTTRAILSRGNSVLWITAQGKFTDARARPVVLEPGLGAVLKRNRDPVTVIPVAIEFTYGDEKLPEVFVSFGAPVKPPNPVQTWTQACATSLEETQDRLADQVIKRDMSQFEVIFGGSVGVGGVYGIWKKCLASLRGQSYDPSHGSLTN